MQLSVAFKNVLLGSHEWCGGFSFVPPVETWKGRVSALCPSSARWLQLPVLLTQGAEFTNPQVKLRSSALGGFSGIYRLHYIYCSFYE